MKKKRKERKKNIKESDIEKLEELILFTLCKLGAFPHFNTLCLYWNVIILNNTVHVELKRRLFSADLHDMEEFNKVVTNMENDGKLTSITIFPPTAKGTSLPGFIKYLPLIPPVINDFSGEEYVLIKKTLEYTSYVSETTLEELAKY